jgi:hypothetical protein
LPEELDPYQVLEVGPDADSEEVRRAFHRAVLRCHPDCGGGDDAAAKDRFGRIVASYRQLRGRLMEQGRDDGQGLPISNQFDPSDFALMSLGWTSRRSGEAPSPGKLEWLPSMVQEKVVEPAVNETRTFVLCWVAAIVLALAAGAVVAAVLSSRGGAHATGASGADGTGAGASGTDEARGGGADGAQREEGAARDKTMLVSVLAMMGTYVAVFALSLTAIVASRKTSWLLRVIGFHKQRSLPPAPHGHKLTDST